MLDNVKKSVFWSSCPSRNSTPQTERQLTDRIRLSNLRQILNFSIMMILVQAVNVSIFCMIHARTRQFGLYMAVIALFVFVMAGNIFLTEYMFRALTKGAGTTRLKYLRLHRGDGAFLPLHDLPEPAGADHHGELSAVHALHRRVPASYPA